MRIVSLFFAFLMTGCISENPTFKRISVRSPFLIQYGVETKPLGISTSGNDHCFAMAIDRFENVFCAGTTSGNFADTNPNPASADLLVLKLDRNGTLLWAKQLGTSNTFGESSGSEACETFAVDRDGNGYCGGSTTGNFAAGLGAGTSDGILVKFSPEGEVLWANQFDLGSDEKCSNLEITSSGRIYCGSTLNDQATVFEFDRHTGQLINLNFHTVLGTSCSGLTSDLDGNLYCAGTFTAATLSTENLVGPSDGMIWKLGPSLNSLATKAFGDNFSWTTDRQQFRDIVIDSLGYLHVGGLTKNNTVSDVNLTNSEDLLFLKLNSRTMNLEWYQQITSSDLNSVGRDTDGDESCQRIASDSTFNTYCSLTTTSDLGDVLTGGFGDIFLTKISPHGTHLSTIQFGQSAELLTGGTYDSHDVVSDLRIDSSGNIYLGGFTSSAFREQPALADILVIRLPSSLSLSSFPAN